MPRVTVIIATYNWSSVLPYSIGSVMRQGFTDWELLVVGDACTDDSATVVEGIIATTGDERIRWINLATNAGNQFGPNNEGLRQARGEFIAYLGHDDLWLPHHLEVLAAALDGRADVAHSVVRWVDPSLKGGSPFRPDECVAPSSVMHRRAVTDSVGVWRNFRELVTPPDLDLWSRARAGGFTFAFVPRLSVVKFPANLRRDVYKLRPSHEQADWFERIACEPNLEAAELTHMLCDFHTAFFPRGRRFHTHLRSVLWQGIKSGWKSRLRPRKKGKQILAWRAFKGLDAEE